MYWHGRLAGLTEQVKMKEKDDKIKSRSKRRAPVSRLNGLTVLLGINTNTTQGRE